MADDLVVVTFLKLQGFEIGHRHFGRGGGKVAIGKRTIGGAVIDAAIGGEAFAFGNAPLFGGGGDQHLASGGAHLAHGNPVVGNGAAAAGGLHAVGAVEIGLLYLHGLPVDVEFFGDQHGQHGFDALADFRVARDEGDGAVGGDLDEGGGIDGRGRGRLLGGRFGFDQIAADDDAAAGKGGNAEERTSADSH